MSEERIAVLEANLRSVTDQVGRLMDQVNQKGFVPAFRCNHSGLLLPGDYVKNWGRDGYGIGLGPNPVSEVLDTDYDTAPPVITPDIRLIEQVMHPVGPCGSQVDLVMVLPEEFNARRAVLDRDDPRMFERVKIVRERQLLNPKSRIPMLVAAFRQAKGGI